MTVTDLARLHPDLVAESPTPTCECRHRTGAVQCSGEADYAVSVVCTEPDCDHAVGVHLLCFRCLDAWRRRADGDGVQLRTRRL